MSWDLAPTTIPLATRSYPESDWRYLLATASGTFSAWIIYRDAPADTCRPPPAIVMQ